ncbi:V-set and transmembrane domain-containing protein 4a isoform X4 [Corythoichthys intestinalis]|uniref:V-set and transmembrane domain-containing protein 4a isoform X4 n=1 Tax=Corythoichthys intestinalis TaxID=161448 RepID=UPI0025A53DF6|nr:V-set and transmembrane domain-containing protein 4a isoform X4 [Corythoichthys intestinalis]
MYISVVLLVLTKVLLIEVCHALNVTVIPGPVVSATERDNLTLSCLVSQRKTSTSTLVLRWFFSPQTSHSPVHLLPPPSPSPTTAPESSQVLIVKMGIKKIKLYGNYTRGFSQPKFRLYEQIEGEAYRLVILNVSGTDRGFYTCRVHEIRKYRNIWRASSNGSSTTQLTASYLLVKCPESSSGETVTSTSSSSSSSPRPQNKYTKHQSDVKVALKPPKLPEDPPPQTPEKVPVASKRPQKPKRSKAPRRSQPRAHQEESLTYAELELVRPTVEPPASTCPDLEPSNPDTVYAQILFQEKQL